MDENERAAIHEAGHVIANDHFGLKSGSVYVIGSDTGQVWPEWSKLPADVDQIVAFAAGVEAERAFGFPEPGPGSEKDAIGERTFARRVIRASDGDWMDSTAVAAMVNRAHERAYKLVQEHRETIATFAATLLANGGRLGGEEVSEALRHAVNGWPTPRFDPASRLDLIVRRRSIFEYIVRRSMPAEDLAAAWEAADEAARSGELPERWKPRKVLISSGSDAYYEAAAMRLARARALLSPEQLRWLDAMAP